MKRDNNLIKSKLSILKKSLFYMQRFDACLHFIFFVGHAHGSDTNNSRYPFGQRITGSRVSNNKADWFHVLSELEYTANKIINASKKNKKIAEDMIKEFLPYEKKFYEVCRSINKTNLKSLSNKKLVSLYNSLAEIYVKKLNSSPLIDGFALTTDIIISEKIERFLEKKGLLNRFVKYFEILTSPVFISFLQEEEIAFLKIAGKIKNNPSLKDKLVEKHQKEFFWIQNNYVKDNILDKSFFLNRLKKYDDKDVNKTIKEIKQNINNNILNKRRLMSELKFGENIQMLLHITDLFNQWQDERKKGTFFATHYFSKLLKEFERRTKYNINQLKYALPPEIEDILNEKISSNELDKRFKDCFIIWTKERFDIVTDKRIIEDICSKEVNKVLDNEIRGISVSLGIAKGKVKVLDTVEDLSKFNEGEVLVAVMTRPDYVPAMEKASAIITDEGGITSHAAIISRELRKPCIVGTKTGTKLLKNGDLVEVDANHGVVKILKRK